MNPSHNAEDDFAWFGYAIRTPLKGEEQHYMHFFFIEFGLHIISFIYTILGFLALRASQNINADAILKSLNSAPV